MCLAKENLFECLNNGIVYNLQRLEWINDNAFFSLIGRSSIKWFLSFKFKFEFKLLKTINSCQTTEIHIRDSVYKIEKKNLLGFFIWELLLLTPFSSQFKYTFNIAESLNWVNFYSNFFLLLELVFIFIIIYYF